MFLDIGTDVDDSLALLMLLHCPDTDFELLGITTVDNTNVFIYVLQMSYILFYFKGLRPHSSSRDDNRTNNRSTKKGS